MVVQGTDGRRPTSTINDGGWGQVQRQESAAQQIQNDEEEKEVIYEEMEPETQMEMDGGEQNPICGRTMPQVRGCSLVGEKNSVFERMMRGGWGPTPKLKPTQ